MPLRLKGLIKCQRRPTTHRILFVILIFVLITVVSNIFETSQMNTKNFRDNVIRESLQDIYKAREANKSHLTELSNSGNAKNISETDALQLQDLMDAMRGKKMKISYGDGDRIKPMEVLKMMEQLREVLNHNNIPIEGTVKNLLSQIYTTLSLETVKNRAKTFSIQLSNLSKTIRKHIVKRKLQPNVESNEVRSKSNNSAISGVNRTGRNIMSLDLNSYYTTINDTSPEQVYNKLTTTEIKILEGIHANESSADEFPFQYLINEPNFCSSRDDLYIINMVATGPWEFIARSRIRSLWGNDKWRNQTGFSTVFLIGSTKDVNLIQKVKEESDIFHDIVQFSFYDSYKNLTLKTLSGLHWVKNFCKNPTWLLKSDTDVLVNTFQLSRFLHNFDRSNGDRINRLICKEKPKRNLTPCRTCSKKKWNISWEEWPHSRYPPHCQGPGYLIPRRLVGAIYNASDKHHPFRMEDIYYTGVVPGSLNLNIKRWNIRDRFPWRPTSWYKQFTNSALMILELDKGVGRGSSSYTWTKILEYEDYRQKNVSLNSSNEIVQEETYTSTDNSS
ncbi:unnamed protein product [Meganyctiphanes norvegica]|uniref:Hexosyltransferase n=1 Tax=Meganyctiphanes norvegica TaxID=48144 RepID=A0AAV2PTI2_MEGNR